MPMLITGRVISGAGSSGMTTFISILITDLVPLRDIATWRSYVNVVATMGHGVGGLLGGMARGHCRLKMVVPWTSSARRYRHDTHRNCPPSAYT
jgi:MFS family permease